MATEEQVQDALLLLHELDSGVVTRTREALDVHYARWVRGVEEGNPTPASCLTDPMDECATELCEDQEAIERVRQLLIELYPEAIQKDE